MKERETSTDTQTKRGGRKKRQRDRERERKRGRERDEKRDRMRNASPFLKASARHSQTIGVIRQGVVLTDLQCVLLCFMALVAQYAVASTIPPLSA